MIKVNLLPQELLGKGPAKASSSSQGGFLVGLVTVAVLLVVTSLFGYSMISRNNAVEAKRKAEAELKKHDADLKALREEYRKIEEGLAVMQNQKAVLEALDPVDRLLWSKKLNMLPLLVPENLFLTDIVVKETVTEDETPESLKATADWVAGGRKGVQPPKVKIPVINQSMEITGLAYSPDNKSEERLRRITLFRNNLEKSEVKIPYTGKEERFITGFQRGAGIGISPIELTAIEGRDVSKFTFSIPVEPVKINLQTPKSALDTPAPAARN